MPENIENENWSCACGTVSSGSFCPACGQKKPAKVSLYCVKCGAEIEPGARFCKSCGASTGGESEPAYSYIPQQSPPVYNRSEAPYSQPEPKSKKKKKRKGLLIAVLGLLALLIVLAIANGGEIGFSTANISQPAMASSVDASTKQPVNKTDVFSTQNPVIYATILVKNAPSDTKITAKWTYVDGSVDIGTVNFQTTQTSQYVAFHLTKPDSGFPVGAYKVEIYLNDKLKETMKFSVKK